MFRKILVLFIVISTAAAVFPVGAANVPRLFNYQAILFDSGGNPLPDGKANLLIRLYNADKEVIYEEAQSVDVVSGVVSAAVGAGVIPGQEIPTGGIGVDGLFPDGPRYLEVEAEGYPPQGLMELVSVPYSSYAETAFQVADGAVGPAQLAKGVLTLDHFTDDLMSRLAARILGEGAVNGVVARDEFGSYKSSVAGPSGGASVGVVPDFTYSGGENVQAVLRDLDLAIKKREEDARMVELSARTYAESQVAGEATVRQQSDATLQNNIDAEKVARSTADSALQGSISALETVSGSYASKSDLDTHVNDTSNPHQVTAEQVGAVTAASLQENYVVKEDLCSLADGCPKPPQPAVSPPPVEIGHGKFQVGKDIVKDDTDLECEFLGFVDHNLISTSSDYVGYYGIKCIIQKTSVSCGGPSVCESPGEIIPQFQLQGSGIDSFPLGEMRVPASFYRWAVLRAISPDFKSCECLDVVGFTLKDFKDIPVDTASVTWKFYRRSIP